METETHSFTSSSSLVFLWSAETEPVDGQHDETTKVHRYENISASRLGSVHETRVLVFVPSVFLHLLLNNNKLSPAANNRIEHEHAVMMM